MKIDTKGTSTTDATPKTMSENEIDAVSGGSFALARPGEPHAGWYNRPRGPLAGGYVMS